MPTELPQEPPDAVRARVLQIVSRQPSPSRRDLRKRSLGWCVLGIALPLALFITFGGAEQATRPWPLIVATCAGTGALTLLALAVSLGRTGRTLGPSRAWLVGVALLFPILLLVWKVACTAVFEGMMLAWPSRPGLRCFGTSLLYGLCPLVTFLLARRRSDPVHPAALGAAFGGAGGLWAATLVDLWCPVGYPVHVVIGHVAPALLLAGLGGFVGARILPPAAP